MSSSPPLTLRQKQSLFAKLVGQLIQWIYAQGWELTFGDFNRPDRQGHMFNSCHYIRLAADLNLFINGVWKNEDCPEWRQIGVMWKSYDPLCRWGGDFPEVDLNHVSITHAGSS